MSMKGAVVTQTPSLSAFSLSILRNRLVILSSQFSQG